MDLTIRPAREEDAASILALLNPLIEAGKYTAMETPFSVDDQLDFMRTLPERSVYHVATDDTRRRIVGIQDVLPTLRENGEFAGVGEISTFVALGFHRQGIGSRLTAATLAAARAMGYSKLNAAIRADNELAVSFYLSQGFRIVAASPMCAIGREGSVDKILAERFLD